MFFFFLYIFYLYVFLYYNFKRAVNYRVMFSTRLNFKEYLIIIKSDIYTVNIRTVHSYVRKNQND